MRFPLRFTLLRLPLLVALLLAAACQNQPQPAPPASTTEPAPATPSPRPQPATAQPSPSPGLALASPAPSPSSSAAPSPSPPVAAPSPTIVSGSPFPLDDYPFAVMIDNIKEARPHFGLDGADVIYEAPAEGGIPRLMPLYLRAGAEVNSIGPVRSARDYFVDAAAEYGTPLVHIGASPSGFAALEATGLLDLDEIRGDGGFTRVRTRLAPHNAFVSTAAIRDTLRQRTGPISASLGPLSFGDFVLGSQPARTISIPYPGAEHYKLEYDYDPDTHVYNRSMDGAPHLDGATGAQYTATSIIIQYADVELVPGDAAGRLTVRLLGSGKAILIAEGTQVPLQWLRSSLQSSTRFTRDDGAPFELPNGQVWVQIVPFETQVSIS